MKKYLLYAACGLVLALAGWYFYPQTEEVLFGADSGALSPATAADDSSFGTSAWLDVANAGTSDNAYATSTSGCNGGTISDERVRIVKGGAIGATDKSSVTVWNTTEAYYVYGADGELWGETWTADDINSADFGTALAVQITTNGGDVFTHYLKATNYGFSIPAGATITGIKVEHERLKEASGSACI